MKKLFFYLLLLISTTDLFLTDTFDDSNSSCVKRKVTLRCGAEYEDCIVPTTEGYTKHIIIMMIFNNMHCAPELIEAPM
jgi:hypothetical protein